MLNNLSRRKICLSLFGWKVNILDKMHIVHWSTNFNQQRLNFANNTNLYAFPVRVRRQNSTIENVMLMDEMVAFLDKEMPNAVDNYVAYPHTLSTTRRRSNRFRVSQRRPEPDSQGQLKADQETMSRS